MSKKKEEVEVSLSKERDENEKRCKDWQAKSYRCHKRKAEGHTWYPVSKTKTEQSEHVTVMMCGHCFHIINVSEVHKFMEAIPSE